MPVVLYIHGLESGPTGSKVRALQAAGFDVRARQMPCHPRRMRADPWMIAYLAAAAFALLAGAAAGPLPFGLALGAAVAARRPVVQLVLRRAVDASVAVQRAALAEGPVDLVVGSSFGGAIAHRLLLDGAWRGPTVLLCPAAQLVAARAGQPPPPGLSALPAAAAARVVVVHGRCDEVVPFDHSVALVRGSAARLLPVHDDHRLSHSASAAGLAAWCAAASAPGRPG